MSKCLKCLLPNEGCEQMSPTGDSGQSTVGEARCWGQGELGHGPFHAVVLSPCYPGCAYLCECVSW